MPRENELVLIQTVKLALISWGSWNLVTCSFSAGVGNEAPINVFLGGRYLFPRPALHISFCHLQLPDGVEHAAHGQFYD